MRVTGKSSPTDTDIHVMMNMDWQDLDFDVPTVDGTALAPGHRHAARRRRTTSSAPATSPSTRAARYRVGNRSIVVLISKP